MKPYLLKRLNTLMDINWKLFLRMIKRNLLAFSNMILGKNRDMIFPVYDLYLGRYERSLL